MEQSQIDRLTMVVMQIQDVEGVFDALCESGISCTHLSSSGGFLGGRNVTLLIGLTQGQEEQVVQILQKTLPAPGGIRHHLTGGRSLLYAALDARHRRWSNRIHDGC